MSIQTLERRITELERQHRPVSKIEIIFREFVSRDSDGTLSSRLGFARGYGWQLMRGDNESEAAFVARAEEATQNARVQAARKQRKDS